MIPATMLSCNSQNRLCEALLLRMEACIVTILHKFYIRRYCILHKQDKVKIETENVKYVM